MKKIITLTALVLCFYSTGFGQNGIYGGGFETWKYISAHGYYEPDSSIFSTLNILDTIPTPTGVSCYRCDTAHSGNYSARLVTRQIAILSVIIPGVTGTLKINWAKQVAVLGIPYPYGTYKPVAFSGYYQSYPVANDSSSAVILLSHWDGSKRDTDAYQRMVFHGTVNSWAPFGSHITYLDTLQPDTLTILLLSSAGYNASNMFGSKGQVLSSAMFDDVSFADVNGFKILLMPETGVKLYPNPAGEFMKIDLSKPVSKGYFEVFDAQARFVDKFQVSGKTGQVSVSNLQPGMYYYQLTENGKTLNSGTFSVIR